MRLRSAFACALLVLTAGRAVAVESPTLPRSRGWVHWTDAARAVATLEPKVAAARAAAGSAARASHEPGAAPLAQNPGPGVLATVWSRNGIPICSTASLQALPTVVSDNAGGIIAAWVDFRRFHYDIYAERLDGNGNPLWSPGGVALAANDSLLIEPVAMPDGAGGAFVIIGQFLSTAGHYSDLLVQHVTSAGAISPGWPANGKSVAPGGATGYGAVPTNDGFLLMGWTDLEGQLRLVRLTGAGGYASGWAAAGLAVGRPQNGNTIAPAPDGAGGAYLCWAESDSVMLTRVAAAGGTASGWTTDGTVVNSGPFSLAGNGLAAAFLTGGDVMVFWPDLRSFTDIDLYAMRYTAAGLPGAGWPATGALAVGGAGFQELPQAVSDNVGGAIMICDVGADSVVAQRMTGTGATSSGWPANGVTLGRHANMYDSAPIPDGANGAILAWSAVKTMNDGIFAQRVGSGGALAAGWPSGGRTVADTTGDQSYPEIATDGSNGVIAVWEDSRDPTTRVFAARTLSDGTVGTLAALVSAAAEPGLVRLHWYGTGGAFDAGIERATGQGAFAVIARVRSDGLGHIRYEDRDVVAGETYQYRLAVEEGGATSYLGAVTLRVPAALGLSLAGFVPNPAVSAPRLAYALPTAERARIEVLDTAGRRVLVRDLDSSPGEHVVSFESDALGPGVYVLRLTQGSRSVTARAAIVR